MSKYLYCIVGKSGSGKDSIVNYLCDRYGYTKVQSYTTRKPRADPQDKYNHTFMTELDFQRDKYDDKVIASTYFDGHHYWTTPDMLDNADFYVIDIQGLKELKRKYKHRKIISIYIDARDDIRIRRMRKRGELPSEIGKRFKNDKEKFSEADSYDFDWAVKNNGRFGIKRICRKINRAIKNNERTYCI